MKSPEAEFKEFELRLKYGWFHLKLYSLFEDLSWPSLETGFGGFETRLKFIKFGLGTLHVKPLILNSSLIKQRF